MDRDIEHFNYLSDRIIKDLKELDNLINKIHNDSKRSGLIFGFSKVINKVQSSIKFLADAKKIFPKISESYTSLAKSDETSNQKYNYDKVDYNRIPLRRDR